MKNKVSVIRTAKQTIVIYREPAKGKVEAPAMRQRAVAVYVLGKKHHYILPNGGYLPVREGWFWRVVKFLRPQSQFAL